jgi:hypothetical protein
MPDLGVKKALDPGSEPATLVGDKRLCQRLVGCDSLKFRKNYIQGNGTSEVRAKITKKEYGSSYNIFTRTKKPIIITIYKKASIYRHQ